jgi:hypothetical protein
LRKGAQDESNRGGALVEAARTGVKCTLGKLARGAGAAVSTDARRRCRSLCENSPFSFRRDKDNVASE